MQEVCSLFSGEHFRTSLACDEQAYKVNSSLPSRTFSEAPLSCDFMFAVSPLVTAFTLSALVSDKKLGKTRRAQPPSELLTYLNANYLLVLYPTRFTAYQDVRMGR